MSERELMRQDLEDIAYIVRTEPGARLLARIIKEANVYNGVFIQDPAMSQFMAGKRSIGLMLLGGLSLDDQKLVRNGEEQRRFMRMGKENDNERKI